MTFHPSIESKHRTIQKKKGWSEVEFICVKELFVKLAKIEEKIIQEKSKMKQAA